MLKSLLVVNKAAKRAFVVATEMSNKNCPKDEMHVKALYKVVKGTRRKQYIAWQPLQKVTPKEPYLL